MSSKILKFCAILNTLLYIMAKQTISLIAALFCLTVLFIDEKLRKDGDDE